MTIDKKFSTLLVMLFWGGAILSMSCAATSNENSTGGKNSTKEDYLLWVDNQKGLIEANKVKLKKVDRHLIPGTDNGGEAAMFVNGAGRPKYTYVGIGGSSSWVTWDFYYNESGKLILVLHAVRNFKVNKEEKGFITNLSPIQGPKESYYLKDDKIVGAKDRTGKNMSLGKAETIKRGKFFQALNEVLLESLKTGETDCDLEDVIEGPYNRRD